MNEDTEAHEMMKIARTRLILDQVFFGMMALRLNLVEDKNRKTAATDGKTLYYNPDFIKSLPAPQRETLIAHEAMHPMLDHVGRLQGRQHKRWNCAGDYVINPILKDSGLQPIDKWLYSPVYFGMSADHIYTLLPEDENDYGDGPGQLEATDEILDGDPETREFDALEWKAAATNAANIAKQMGCLPANLQRFVEETIGYKVDWRAQLRRFITDHAKDDYSFCKPNKFFIHLGFFLPTLYSESIGTVVVVIDTSGSIDQPTLNAFGAETKAIVSTSKPSKLYVIYCDSAVNHVDVFEPYDDIKFEMHGGGGTKFEPAFTYVEDNDIKPVALIYLTDLMGPLKFTPPNYPTLWCCTTDLIAPFGETVPLSI